MMRALSRRLGFVLAAGLLVSCDGGGEPLSDAGPDNRADRQREVLRSVGERAILPTYERFRASASELEARTAAFAADPGPDQREAAQAAWLEAVDVWQEAEVFQLGPAGMTLSATGGVAGGLDIRDQIYSWPLTNTCRIDQETVDEAHADPAMMASKLVNVRGLDAMEYLLFVEGAGNTCNAMSQINSSGSWAALGEEGVIARRAAYAHTLARLIVAAADELVAAWRDGFLDAFANAGLDRSVYSSSQEALNALSDALFYVETEVKDMKLAQPVGIMGCSESVCPEALESRYARRSREHMIANLRAFDAAYHGVGEGGLGFDDLLRDIGADDVADGMSSELTTTIEAFEAIEQPFHVLVAEDPDVLRDLHATMRPMTTRLKTEFVTVLDLDLPARAEGDND